VDFRILGPLEVLDGDRPVALGGAKQRSLLALLLLARGRPVTTDLLIEEIWNGEPPETARKSVHGYVSSLREALGEGRIRTLERGYRLHVEPTEVDADRLDDVVRSSTEATPADALTRLREGLELVRGDPLEDFRGEPWADTEATHLDELVLTALERRFDAELELGEHGRLIQELERLVAKHPYREHLLEQLVVALYRSGRQADALEAHRRAVARLRTELGLEPGRRLRTLEQAILNHDAALEPKVRAKTPRERRRRGWKFVAFGGAVLAGAAGAAAVLLASDGGVRLQSLEPGVVLLDMEKQEVVARWPHGDFEFPWITTGNGRFWVASFNAPFTAIDPRTGRFVHRLLPPFASSTNLALPRARSIWFTGTGGVARYDLAQRRETARYRVLHGTHRFGLYGVAFGAGSLWVASQEENEVVRLDPVTGSVEARIPVRAPVWLSFGDGALWVTSDLDGVERIDPTTNGVAAVAQVPQPIDRVVVGGGFAWATNGPKGTTYKIDSSGRIIAAYETGDGAHEPSYSEGKLWVSNGSAGTLTSIDAATGARRTYRFGHPLGSEAALGRYVMVAITEGLTVEDQLANLDGRIAKLIIPTFQLDPPDPPLVSNAYAFQVERATCAGLLRYAGPGQILEPELAAAMPSLSPDGRTYTFTVRRGVHFAPPSGAVVTAAAIRYSIRRALSPQLGTPNPAAGYLSDLSRIRVHGDRISFRLRERSPNFLERLSLPYYCTVPLDTPILNGGVQPIAPPSAGPYYMSARHNGDWTVLRRNPNYRGSRPARLDAIVLREGVDSERAASRVEDGEWDGLALDDAVVQPGGAVADRFRGAAPSDGITYRVLPRARLEYIAFNSARDGLRSAEVRQRIAAGVDRAALAAYRSLTATSDLLPPGIRGGTVETPDRHVARVGRLRLRLALDRECGHPCAQFAALLSAELRQLGVVVSTVARGDLAAAVHTPGADIDLAVLSTELPYPDPASFLARMLGRDVPRAWLRPETRRAVSRLATLSGRARDRAAVSLAKRIARVDVPVVAYGTPQIGTLLRSRLGCRRWDAFNAQLDLTTLCVQDR
jgi:DNA-binding SARP family transcriptional activator